MQFEKQLREKLYQSTINQIEEDFKMRWEKNIYEETLRCGWVNSIENAYSIYVENEMKDMSEEQLFKLYDEFDEAISAKALMELKGKTQLEEREKAYVKYQEQFRWVDNRRGAKAVVEILVRRVLLEKFKGKSIEEILQVLEAEAKQNSEFALDYPYVAKLISGDIFDIEEALQQKISEKVEHYFNDAINCGGYALKVDVCVFPRTGEFDKSVSAILDNFSFVRLLGDTELQDDEYLVLYRNSEKGGHHFIRIEDDGTVVEKNDCQSPQKFQGWGNLEGCKEAVFAVKKEHEMHYSEEGSVMIPDQTSMNFGETVWDAIKNKQNTFEYHNHNYILKKSGKETIYICSKDEVIAEMVIDDNDYDVEIRQGKEGYVSNVQPKNPIIIKDGQYQEDEVR